MAARPETRTGGRAATTGVIPGDFSLSVGLPDKPSPDGWKWTPLTDVARLESGHTPSRKHPEYWGGDVPWIGIKDATENHGQVINDTLQHTNALGIANSSARILPANTVCLSRTASVGYVVVMGRPMATSQDFVNWVCSERLDHRFLRYVLLAERSAFLRFASGTTHQTIYFPEVKAFHVCLPTILEQRKIADVLSGLDEKIQQNHQIAETLERMVQALFQSWFVDFDPVRAKMEGRDTGLPAAIADLFPSRLADSALGEIPEGWRWGRVADVAEVIYGAPFASARFNDQGVGTPLIRIRDLSSESPGIWTPEVHPKGYRVRPGDVLVGMDGEFRPYLWGGPEAWLNQRVCAFKPSSGWSAAFVRESIRRPLAHVEATETATTVIHLGKADIDHFDLVVPEPSIAKQFGRLCQTAYERIVVARQESRTLASLRDTLLPKLISGELRVKEAEKFVA